MRQRKRAQGERSETLTKELPEAIGGDGDDGESKGFYACYLLVSLSPRHKGHTYIGFTVNPRRRIRQHNGEIGCGAWRTKKRRPWEMVLCIHGFPSNVSALQFEWAWQHPNESLAVRKAAASFKSLSGTANKIKLAYTMLTLPSWRSLNITVNYFSTKYTKHSAGCPSLPPHMKVKICPMDELPCYVKGDESLFENDDGWDNKEEGDEVCSGSKTAKETLSNSMFGRAEEQDRNEIGDEMADGLYGWIREGEDCREQFTFAELPAKGDESLFENDDGWDNKEEGDEVCSGIKTAKETLSNSMFGRAEEQDRNEIGDKMADGLYGWIREGEDCREQFTFAELPARPCSNVSTNGSVVGEYADYTGFSGLIKDGSFDSRRPAKEPSKFLVTIDDDQTPSSQNVPSEVVVIDVTTPSPLCQNSLWRNKSYERVRKKEGHIAPSEAEVIDLTTPSPLSRSSLWSNLINYA